MEEDLVFDAAPKKSADIDTPKTLLDELRVELAKVVEKPPVVFQIPSRPKIALEFSIAITTAQLRRWQQAARIKNTKTEDYDALRFSAIVIANQNTAIIMNGEPIIDSEGSNVTVRDTVIRDYVNATDAVTTVTELYGYDGHVIDMAAKLLEAAGFNPDSNEEADAEDPILTS